MSRYKLTDRKNNKISYMKLYDDELEILKFDFIIEIEGEI